MNNGDLFALRHGGLVDFDNTSALLSFLGNLLGKDRKLPMVVGHRDLNPKKEWQVEELSPLREMDRLTVDNYFQALEQLNHATDKDFQCMASIHYDGVDSLHYGNKHSKILGAYVRDVKNPDQSLDICFYFNSVGHFPNERAGYNVFSELTQSKLERISKRFVGPNNVYEHQPDEWFKD